MNTRVVLLACAALAQCQAQSPSSHSRTPKLAEVLSFETEHAGKMPKGWFGGPAATISVDDEIVHGGKWSVRLERDAASAQGFSTITAALPIDFTGNMVEMRGFLRTQDVSDFVGLWMREDGDQPNLILEDMQKAGLKGTHDWAEFSITVPVLPEAKQLYFGFLLSGTGKAWADDLQLLVDGKPIWEAAAIRTVLNKDDEFDAGSKISLKNLSGVQAVNLTTLGKVWGFLKYHHPQVTSGKYHWDYQLFRVIPAILAAPDRATANTALLRWIKGLGEVPKCELCIAVDEADLHLRPRLGWLDDEKLLGAELARELRAIHANRPVPARQFYVSLMPGVGNPKFESEPAYERVNLPDAGYQILALYRFWNIIEYWFPYRDILDEDWDKVLAQFIPRIGLAPDSEIYQRELIALMAKVHDTHTNLWSSLKYRPPVGDCALPLNLRFIENQAVVTGLSSEASAKAGDVITALDGVPVSKLMETWAPYYAASNEPTRLRDIARSMTRGACVDAKVRMSRAGGDVELTVKRVTPGTNVSRTHDLPGEAFQVLPNKVAYLKLSSVKLAEAAKYVKDTEGTKGLIIDIRNYPSAFLVFAMGSLLVDKATEFARFTNGDLSNPGTFRWTKSLSLSPQRPHYSGKIVILIDEVTQSSAEYHSMAFRTAPKAIVMGSTTAGADGNVSHIPLPGGLRTMITGIGVFYPNKQPTQRVGIVPDIVVKPTIDGVRAGKDEVLDAAIKEILK